MTGPVRRHRIAAVGLVASLAGLPLLLVAAAGPPAVGGLPTWGWVADGLRDQYLPVEPLLAALGVLAWGLWAYAMLMTVLRLVAVVAVRRGVGGSAGLLALSNLVTVAPLRSLVDAAVGVSLLASASHAVAAPATLADPPAVVRIVDAPAGWDRASELLGAVQPDLGVAQPGVAARPQQRPWAAAADPDCPADASDGRVYVVQEGDSLWRIADRELGGGHRWREIFAANQGRRMSDGQLLADGGLILPGWQLLLPPPPDQPPLGAPEPPAAASTPATRPEPPPPAPTPAPTSAPGGSEPPSAAVDPDDDQPAGRRDIVELPSGSMVGLSLAVGIAAALAVAGLRRRRRRRPLWPPTPASRRAAGRPSDTARLLAFAATRATQPPDTDPIGQQDPPPAPRVPAAARDPRDPTPARVAIGERAGREVTVDVAGYGAVGILGPGADGLVRAAMVGLVAAGGPAAVEVLLVGNQLIPGAIGFPGLRRAASLAGALHVVEAELVHRARLLEAEDIPDFARHRREHPDDPLPALILVADGVSLEQAGRLAAILAQGPRLGVGALLPGTSVEAGAQLVLDDRGRVQAATPWELGDQQLVGVHACSLTEVEAAELLGVLAQSRTDDPEPSDPGPPDVAADAGRPVAAASDRSPDPEDAVDALGGLAADRASTEALVQVQVLGPFTIQTATGELRSGLRASARELLAYYLVHPGGASLEQAVEAIWPDTEPGRERERFWTALGNLRTVLRKATGADQLKAIQRDGLRYRVEALLRLVSPAAC
jgi:LysM domain